MIRNPPRILIVDDHSMVRTAICTWINTIPQMELVGEAVNGEDALNQALTLMPDVILMDLIMPKMDGIEATREIKKVLPDVSILMVTSFTEINRAVEAIQAGIKGFILKDASLDELLEAITMVSKGKTWFPVDLTRAIIEEKKPPFLR